MNCLLWNAVIALRIACLGKVDKSWFIHISVDKIELMAWISTELLISRISLDAPDIPPAFRGAGKGVDNFVDEI